MPAYQQHHNKHSRKPYTSVEIPQDHNITSHHITTSAQQHHTASQALSDHATETTSLFAILFTPLAMIGTIPGVLVAQWVLHMQNATQALLPAHLLSLGAVLLMALVAAFATIPAIRVLNRMQVTDVLRAE